MTWEGTDDLRNYLDGCPDSALALSHKRKLWNIADRIDEAHRAECDMNYSAGFSMGISPKEMTDEDLAELGLVRLPVDEDGEVWHSGDMAMESGRIDTVSKLVLGVDGWALALTSTVGLFEADVLRHHKPTPAERIRAVAEQVLNADTSQARIEANDALYAIADELEGGAEC